MAKYVYNVGFELSAAVMKHVKMGELGECWPWTGSLDNYGWPQFCVEHCGRTTYIHARVAAYEVAQQKHLAVGDRLRHSQSFTYDVVSNPDQVNPYHCCNPVHMVVYSQGTGKPLGEVFSAPPLHAQARELVLEPKVETALDKAMRMVTDGFGVNGISLSTGLPAKTIKTAAMALRLDWRP